MSDPARPLDEKTRNPSYPFRGGGEGMSAEVIVEGAIDPRVSRRVDRWVGVLSRNLHLETLEAIIVTGSIFNRLLKSGTI